MIWNTSKSLADVPMPAHGNKKRYLAKQEDARRVDYEEDQLHWKPEPGRRPYAGKDED
jgi:hypothetical protein